jgi:iron complex outermembrane receptor protein
MQRYILPGFVCVFLAQFGMAEEAPSLPFSETNDLPMVLSATRLQQSLFDAPAAVTVIDHQMIEQSGIREIPELLRLVPGMVVGYESGSEAFVSHHGTSADLARRMQVLVDGRSIYQPLLASVDWIGLPLDIRDIERIEVIRGPNAASYGVNSFFAVVNIITRHPADVTGETVSYRRGENGIEDYHARIAKKVGAVDWQLSLTGRADEGFTDNRWPTRSVDEFADSKNVDCRVRKSGLGY